MNINSQFESFNFVSGSHKTQSTPRVKKVALVASVVLLLAGAYYYGASTTKAPQVHNSTTLFRSYTPSSDIISVAQRSALSTHFGEGEKKEEKKEEAKPVFHLVAVPIAFSLFGQVVEPPISEKAVF